MKNQWLGKSVDLGMLAERIRPFFPEVDFDTTVERIREGYVIQAVSRIPNMKLDIGVWIEGGPNDFIVEFSAGGKRGYFSPSMILGNLTTMFGGGYLISREAKRQEALDILERDFWRHTQMRVADLVDSATNTG